MLYCRLADCTSGLEKGINGLGLGCGLGRVWAGFRKGLGVEWSGCGFGPPLLLAKRYLLPDAFIGVVLGM